MDKAARVDLKYPIEVDGTKVSSLRMRRPKVRDILATDGAGSDARKELRLFSNLTELPPEALETMDLADYQALQEVYQGFLEERRPTAGGR
jgi:hypothetical protein